MPKSAHRRSMNTRKMRKASARKTQQRRRRSY